MKPFTRQGCILASALLLAVPSLAQQASSPRLAAYYAEVQWTNDGAGHFSTLKVEDFVPPGKEWLIGSDLLVATRNGYTFITTQLSGCRTTGGAGGLPRGRADPLEPQPMTPGRSGPKLAALIIRA